MASGKAILTKKSQRQTTHSTVRMSTGGEPPVIQPPPVDAILRISSTHPPPQQLIIEIPSNVHDVRSWFKEKSGYLFLAWGSTLVSMAYMHANLVRPNNDAIMDVATFLLAGSFILWLLCLCLYDYATTDLRKIFFVRVLLYSCFGSTITSLGITFLTLYLPGYNPKKYSIIFGSGVFVSLLIAESQNHEAMRTWEVARYGQAEEWVGARCGQAREWVGARCGQAKEWVGARYGQVVGWVGAGSGARYERL
ncbi:hypothetical protein L1987_80291 [Smallanthus sonchifolius]|uniref:Uncharacterized protein n=1 Tax=Smallanthus sonchifolius TaxID=185202 RepID=A0ACB8YMX0_9ASTR|nr:hypothetical protein L1987_80291 [Smallanthus sonchifolius]